MVAQHGKAFQLLNPLTSGVLRNARPMANNPTSRAKHVARTTPSAPRPIQVPPLAGGKQDS